MLNRLLSDCVGGKALVIALTVASSCLAPSTHALEAIDLAIEARHAWNAAVLAEIPFQKAELLRGSQDALQRIVEEFPESNLAVRVTGGQPVAGLTEAKISRLIDTVEDELGPCFAAPSRQCVLDAALAQAESLPDVDHRALAFANVAGAMARVGEVERAAEHRDLALLLVAEGPNEHPLHEDVLEALVWVDTGLGAFERAEATLAEIEVPLLRAWAYSSLIDARLDAGQREEAYATVEDFERYASSEQPPAVAAQVQALLSLVYARLGENEKAFLSAYDAVDLADAVKDWSESDPAYAFIVGALAAAGEIDWALRTGADEIGDPAYRCVSAGMMLYALAEVGNVDVVRESLPRFDRICPKPENADELTEYAYFLRVHAMARLGAFVEAIDSARRIGGTGIARAWTLSDIAWQLPPGTDPLRALTPMEMSADEVKPSGGALVP